MLRCHRGRCTWEKVDTLTHHIKELINQYYQRYIKTEEIIPELEKLI